MSSLVSAAAALLVAGTLTMAVDAVIDQPRRVFSAAGKLLWCAAGVLGSVVAAVGVVCLAIGNPSGNSVGALAVEVLLGALVAVAAVLILRMYGFWPRTRRQLSEARRDQQPDIER